MRDEERERDRRGSSGATGGEDVWEGRGEGGVAIISRVRYRSLIRHAARGNARLESKLDDAREAVSGHLLSSPSALIPLHPTSAPARRLIHGSSASRPAIQIHFLVAIQITRRKNKKRHAVMLSRRTGRKRRLSSARRRIFRKTN